MTIYFGCSKPEVTASPSTKDVQDTRWPSIPASKPTDSTAQCVVTVTVPADPAANTCTLTRKTMNLEVTSKSKSVSFKCDTDIATLTPAVGSGMIYDELCKKEVTLSETLPTAKLEGTTTGYTFSIEELPENAATFCYKCLASTTGNQKGGSGEQLSACTVKINVSAAVPDSDFPASGATGSTPALVFGLAGSVLSAVGGF
ncbi:SAG-related sequence SRS52C [Toxoplasma gondii TgCatPRC2]|uniref:SAG-related sequence SRS52C n=5 Tax=Toxoplasma gondii TaxID=5811 RepID=A0A125YGI0_TOXGV|nr:SAG-related sequence SRS52C [Toxoplasma gondii ME49]ESS35361.1 SAG-related sequence SRS52C [Toxoplasma gondii VEG]KFG36872.1 SAG-related sequence SRS52C [Toxoplasma gondii GAB2-2007-GAL-DOM2]KYF40165.1 SAG-related sequence SRS52C [Toxoplasma gondii ARI]KYK65710.1 SAG-related sequence SRS52C [Toxoplasma gondii TgCatPRC2]EPT25752.1 SAG-related sequence SRS52C [Toxoplasma gondii ME49]|eukprot:XP_018635337.1 SAG-related sequence SRS52C [Toxoplasma gondii ME49]